MSKLFVCAALQPRGLIREIVADGDMVVVLRDLYRPWPGGPAAYMKTSFADIWRVRGGKMTEQWATVSPGDGFSSLTQGNCKYYHDDLASNPPLLTP
jgi:predicted SnoaL-like aldol condensation-catalyzing enzyme